MHQVWPAKTHKNTQKARIYFTSETELCMYMHLHVSKRVQLESYTSGVWPGTVTGPLLHLPCDMDHIGVVYGWGASE